jgi:acyl-CoA synthetase (AMP-forming)/AMP-acid ligase II/pimeloyl-ACP methyl ester carboxylesterase
MTVALPSVEQWQAWGIDPAWSRLVDVPSHDGGTWRWHLLDRPGVGDPALPTVVCVHGNPTWSVLWQRVLAGIDPRLRVLAVDQLGMGCSQRTPRRRYADRVRDLDDVLGALGIDGEIVMVGHDWGGAVAQGWAVGPGAARLAGLALVNTGIAVPAGRRAPWLIRLAATGPITDVVGHRSRVFVDGTIRLSGRRLPGWPKDALRHPYRGAASREHIAWFVDDVPFDDRHPSAAVIATVADGLRGITAPTLLSWGALDPVFDDSFADDLFARLPHADRHRFPDAGHLAPLEVDVAGVLDVWLRDRVIGPAPTRPGSSGDVGGGRVESARPPVWAALDERAAATPEAPAFVDGASLAVTSMGELQRMVHGVAGGLADLGVRPGDRVALLVPPSVELVACVYGVWRAGGVTVIADRGLGIGGLGRAVRAADVQWVIGPRPALAAARALRWAPGARRIAVEPSPVQGAVTTFADLVAGSHPLPPEPSLDDPAAVLFTSGATGPAKGVRYRHGQLAAQRDALAATYGITTDDRLVAAFAPFALYGPALGIASTIPDVDVAKPGTLTAAALRTAISSVDATIVFASPAALANVVRTATPGTTFEHIRLALSAGAPVPVATLEAIARLMPGTELHTPYGMTECLPVADVSLTEIHRALDADDPVGGVCVGHPVPGASVRIAPLGFDAVAPLGAPEPVGRTGEVLVHTPWVSDGYDGLWRTQRDARPIDADGRTWHRSGDVGHLDAEGRLWIEGRSVHVVHTDRGPLTPVPVEVGVERLPGVSRCAAVGVGPAGCQVLVVVIDGVPDGGDEGLVADDLAAAVRGVVEHPVAAVLQVDGLPVDIRHNTKIDRALVARWAGSVLSGSRTRRPW